MGAKKDKTLCWQCAKACGKCSWSGGKFIPVEGWVAEPVFINDVQCGKIRSYRVQSCPEFVSDLPPIANKQKVEIKKKRKNKGE